MLDAIRGGNGFLAAACGLVLAVSLARKFGASRYPFLSTKAGGAAVNVLLSFGGMVATALAAGSLPTWALAGTALGMSVTAAGGFTLIKELAAPALRWAENKAPAWARPFLAPMVNILLWAFEKRNPVADAEKAGRDALKAKASPGIKGAGKMKIKDVP